MGLFLDLDESGVMIIFPVVLESAEALSILLLKGPTSNDLSWILRGPEIIWG